MLDRPGDGRQNGDADSAAARRNPGAGERGGDGEPDEAATAAQAAAARLQADLVKRLTAARLSAEPYFPGTNHPGAAVLRVSITEAEPGSYWERFVIGFGLGRAELQAKADLESGDTTETRSLTAFNTSSATGRVMPGLVLPGAIALATRSLVPLAVGGGLKLATSFRGGLDQSADGTAKAVVEQLKKYYASVGWHWPEEPEA
jgi:hypothetical protein